MYAMMVEDMYKRQSSKMMQHKTANTKPLSSSFVYAQRNAFPLSTCLRKTPLNVVERKKRFDKEKYFRSLDIVKCKENHQKYLDEYQQLL